MTYRNLLDELKRDLEIRTLEADEKRLRALHVLKRDLEISTEKGDFAYLFPQGLQLLDLDNDDAAAIFDTSVPNIAKWRSGMVPPVSSLILYFLYEEVVESIARYESGVQND